MSVGCELARTLQHAVVECNVVVVDFDGVLARPWSMPEELFAGVADLLRQMHACGARLCLASFNPNAARALERHGLLGYFAASRSGSNEPWSVADGYHRGLRTGMSKAAQIQSMLLEIGGGCRESDVVFFDDDTANIENVRIAIPDAKVVFIATTSGIDERDVIGPCTGKERDWADIQHSNECFEYSVNLVRTSLGGTSPRYDAPAIAPAPGQDYDRALRTIVGYLL
jgi:hypothetical protein